MAERKPFVWGASGVELLQSGDTLAGVTPVVGGLAPHYITTSQTWICPTGISTIIVELWGAGASGGKSSSALHPGGGGGGGAYAVKTIAITTGESIPITIGVGGASQTGTGSIGNNGGASSFGVSITCGGGYGGLAGGNQGAFVRASVAQAVGGDLNVSGGAGYYISVMAASTGGVSVGGASVKAHAVVAPSVSSTPGVYPGGGGTGITTGGNSGAGADGLCIIWY